jgi:hypothetical protein
VSQIPREAREGLMRAWLEILRDRHLGTSWILEESTKENHPPVKAHDKAVEPLSTA